MGIPEILKGNHSLSNFILFSRKGDYVYIYIDIYTYVQEASLWKKIFFDFYLNLGYEYFWY